VDSNFFTDLSLHRCVDNFLCQFGAKMHSPWDRKAIPDDDLATSRRLGLIPFKRGYMSFAGNGPNSRSSHLFVTLGRDVGSLGTELWETPFGYVEEDSMQKVVSKWYTKYGDMAPWGKGPDPGKISSQGNAYLNKNFPNLDFWQSCKRRGSEPAAAEAAHESENDVPVVARINSETKPAAVEISRYVLNLAPNLGAVIIEVDPSLAPLGAARLIDMLSTGYLDGARFFRVVPEFVAQFGLPADPKTAKKYAQIKDDPIVGSNTKGTISFASAGPNTRSNQLFINLGNNARLDGMGFSPVGKVVQGMDIVERIYAGYGEKPNQGLITNDGLKYLNQKFPKLSYIDTAVKASDLVVEPAAVVNQQAASAEEGLKFEPALAQPKPLNLGEQNASSPMGSSFLFLVLAVIIVAILTAVRFWKKTVVRLPCLKILYWYLRTMCKNRSLIYSRLKIKIPKKDKKDP